MIHHSFTKLHEETKKIHEEKNKVHRGSSVTFVDLRARKFFFNQNILRPGVLAVIFRNYSGRMMTSIVFPWEKVFRA